MFGLFYDVAGFALLLLAAFLGWHLLRRLGVLSDWQALHATVRGLRERRSGVQVPCSDEHLLDVAYSVGVARVGGEGE